MKKIKITIFVALVFMLNSADISAQDSQVNDVITPLGSTVNSWLMEESSSTVREGWDDYFSNSRPNAVQIETYDGYSSTKRFNCHGYAWYMSPKTNVFTNPRWIGYYPLNTDEHIYWDDGSYIEVTSETYPGMVSWASGDHSAITTSTPGKWKSKWNEYPLFLHDWDDTMYGTSDLKYYAPLSFSIPDYVLCYGNNTTLSSPDYVNCTYSWTYNTALLDYVSGQGTKNFTVTPKYSSSAGLAWVKLTLTIGAPVNKPRSIIKYIAVNAPHPDDLSLGLYTTGGSPVSFMCPDTYYHIYLTNNGGCSLSNYSWTIPAEWSYMYQSGNMVSVYTNSSPGGRVEVDATTCCGTNTTVFIGYLYDGYCGSMYSIILSPNPTSGETILSFEPISEDTEFDINEEWDLEIYNNNQTLKEKKTKLKGNEYRLNTSGWKEGVYIVRALYKGEILTGKLVVQR